MGSICGYAGNESREKAEKMLSASQYCGKGKIWHTKGIAMAQISPESELQGFACDGRFYDGDVRAFKNVQSTEDLKAVLLKSNGDYALAIVIEDKLLLARDPIGTRSLYYGFDNEGFAFAAEKAMLRALAIKDVKVLNPGNILIDDKKPVDFRGEILREEEKLIEDEALALSLLRNALDRAIKIRVKALSNKKMGVLFSGGVDSSTLASKIPEANLYVAGISGSHDLEQARKSAKAMGVEGKLRAIEIDLREVEERILDIISIIETANPMDVEMGLTLFFAGVAMSEDGIEVAISGQGSDELFGGYRKYAATLRDHGAVALQQELKGNIMNIASENLERDVAVSAANFIELVTPYLDIDLIKLVLSFDPKLKIRARENAKSYIGKYILRKLAGEFLPGEIAWKDKKAMQYGSGIHAALKAIASKNGFTGAIRSRRYLASIANKDKRC